MLPVVLYSALMLIAVIGLLPWGRWSTLMPGDVMQWSLAMFLLALEMAFIFLIWIGTRPRAPGDGSRVGINLERLLSEHDGSASFSRFQFLIFTFVVASGYVVQVFVLVQKGSALPDIPNGVLALIGISGGSYLVAKGIEKTGQTGADGAQTTPAALPGEKYRS
jgi:hypothetical protein